jgi:rhodanese-related sulfurtransferase
MIQGALYIDRSALIHSMTAMHRLILHPSHRSIGSPHQRRHAHRCCKATPSDGSSTNKQYVQVLGQEDFILSQVSGVEEELFKGKGLGVFADIASTSFRSTELRQLSGIPNGLKPPSRFLDIVAVHLVRNLLATTGAIPGASCPLVLGIWGEKGVGKTFNLELSLKAIGALPIVISAGELEDEWAGEPGRRLRERFEFAHRHQKITNELTCIVIHDLDIGVGRYSGIQNTVNSQNFQGTVMALCDQMEERIPIFITANDLTTLYAPMVRDGRMAKFFFQPTFEERLEIISNLFSTLSVDESKIVLSSFQSQPLDFFAAVRSSLVDHQIMAWVRRGQLESLGERLLGPSSCYEIDPVSAWTQRDTGADIHLESYTLAEALAAGKALELEQDHVNRLHLSQEYFREFKPMAAKSLGEGRDVGFKKTTAKSDAPPPSIPSTPVSKAMQEYWDEMKGQSFVSSKRIAEQEEIEKLEKAKEAEGVDRFAEEAPAKSDTSNRPWPVLSADQVAKSLAQKSALVIDVRSSKEAEWGKIKGSLACPFTIISGSSMSPVVTAQKEPFLKLVSQAAKDSKSIAIILVGSAPPDESQHGQSKEVFKSKALSLSTEDYVEKAALALLENGYSNVAELGGGFTAYDLSYRPDGRRREKGSWKDKSSGELEYWTASN